jgi:hypothetical protein
VIPPAERDSGCSSGERTGTGSAPGAWDRLPSVSHVPALPREWNDYFTRTAMLPLRVEGFNMSSVSQAS